MSQCRPSQVDDDNLAYYYSSEQTPHGIYHRLKFAKEGFPSGFYASERAGVSQQPVSSSSNPTPSIQLSIAINIGEPLDYQEYRHTSLCLRPDDETPPLILRAGRQPIHLTFFSAQRRGTAWHYYGEAPKS